MFVKKFSTTAVLPVRATAGSGGYDLAADLPAPVVIEPGQSAADPHRRWLCTAGGGSGAGVWPQRAGGSPRHRPGQRRRRHRLGLPRGDPGAAAQPVGGAFTVRPGDRIAQMVVVPALTPPLELTEDLGPSARGEQGFGSTGLAAKEG